MAKTKPQLEKENKELRDKVKELQYEIADLQLQQSNAESKGDELPDDAFGIFYTGEKYQIAFLKFDPVSRDATVVSVEDVAKNPLPYANAHFRGTQELDEMMAKVAKK